MEYYVNCIREWGSLQREVKELIPDMNMRRRMGRLVKMGVATAMETLAEFEPYGAVDAIITATGLGCTADSERFLADIITSGERMLTPTPFIQSTFNTVGAQIALIKSLHCHNNTFTHRYTSFESALVEAMVRLDSGSSGAVLVGVFDESTPTTQTIMNRMGLLRNNTPGEGALFFVLTAAKLDCSAAAITALTFDERDGAEALRVSRSGKGLWCGAVAQVMADALRGHTDGELTIINDLGGRAHSTLTVRCLQQ